MKIFVGSTVKDLEDLRDQLYYKIKAWGHTPLLSEFPDFHRYIIPIPRPIAFG